MAREASLGVLSGLEVLEDKRDALVEGTPWVDNASWELDSTSAHDASEADTLRPRSDPCP